MPACPYCESAKRLLKQKGAAFEEKLVDYEDEKTWDELEEKTGYKTMPQIFIGDKFIGGYNDLAALDKNGELDALLK